MKVKDLTEKKLTFRTRGREPLMARVKKPDASLGKIAAQAAARLGIAGTFECLDSKDRTLSPQTRLADLPDETITLAPDLTPAWQAP